MTIPLSQPLFYGKISIQEALDNLLPFLKKCLLEIAFRQ